MIPGLIRLELPLSCPYPEAAIDMVEATAWRVATPLISEKSFADNPSVNLSAIDIVDAVRSRLIRTHRINCPMLINGDCPSGLDCQLSTKKL